MGGIALSRQKQFGAYYTPDAVVRSLVSWVHRSPKDRMLDPSCGDGRFLAAFENSVGVEQDPVAANIVHSRSPGSLLHEGDFFSWAAETNERFECAAGNPPFIRYQRFTGATRNAARELCARNGVKLSALSSSWAPFLVATSTLLKPGGRMAFVVPAEIGHANYARVVLEYLVSCFSRVQVIPIREKLFPNLSEDCWLLYADGFGYKSRRIYLTPVERFSYSPKPPNLNQSIAIGLGELTAWNGRLRPFLLPHPSREAYQILSEGCARLGDIARVGIGYVTGANDFFHMRPSEARRWRIPERYLVVSVRNSRCLRRGHITKGIVDSWIENDDRILLLRINRNERLGSRLKAYLDSPAGEVARITYKCRVRTPWYSVPDVTVPDAFLSYMSGRGPTLVENTAGCVGTNSVHVVHLKRNMRAKELAACWTRLPTQLSCEVEGHPLGGGMLKVEPREASRVLLGKADVGPELDAPVREGIRELRRWRHCAEEEAVA